MNAALVVVDYTWDFIAAEGRLSCGPPGRMIEDRIAALAAEFAAAGSYVVMAVDYHRPDDPFHPETNLFPAHNVEGTGGRELYGKLQAAAAPYRDAANWHEIAKTRYSAFAGTDLDLRLRERSIRDLHLAGVCTDICVLHTAVDAYNLGYSIFVHSDAVQSFNAPGHRWALEHFRQCLGAVLLQDGRPQTPQA